MDITCMRILRAMSKSHYHYNKYELGMISKNSDAEKAIDFLRNTGYIADDGRSRSPDKPITYELTQQGKNYLDSIYKENLIKCLPIAISILSLIVSVFAILK